MGCDLSRLSIQSGVESLGWMCLAHRLDVLQPAVLRLGRDDDRRAMVGLAHEAVRIIVRVWDVRIPQSPDAHRSPLGHSRKGLCCVQRPEVLYLSE